MFIPDLKMECDLLKYCCEIDGEIEITSKDFRNNLSARLNIDVTHVFFAPDADCAPVGIVVEYEAFGYDEPWMCFPACLTPQERNYFHIEPWQEYIEN